MTDDRMKQEKKRKEVIKKRGQGGEGEVNAGGREAEDGGRGQEERGFILRLFVTAASRTTTRRENGEPRK